MKASNRSNIITGIVLLVLSALFSISLIIQPLDFGIAGPGHNNIFYEVGRMLYSVYGFSSILIPVFLLIAGISCFASKWTSKKTMQLITALVPFFTAVLTEKICRASLNLGNPNGTAVKVAIAIVTGILLIGIEIIGAGIIAESVNQKIFYRNKKPKASKKIDELNLSFEDSNSQHSASLKEKVNDDIEEEDDLYENTENQEDYEEDVSEDFIEEAKKNSIHSIFDKALEKIKNRQQKDELEEEAEDYWEEAEDYFDEEVENTPETDASSIDDLETDIYDDFEESHLADEEEKIESPLQASEEPVSKEEETELKVEEPLSKTEDSIENNDDENMQNPASIISQEEYAALIQNDYQEEPEEEELEWPNLPPQPETLPPEYVEDFDEDDPALEFPPKDEEIFEDTDIEEESSLESDLEEIQENTNESTDEDDANIEEIHEVEEVEEINDYEEDEATIEIQREPILKYSDAVNENPAFPHGIMIHDEDEEIEDEEEKQEPVPERKYPVKISLEEEDETLPPPDYNNMDERAFTNARETLYSKEEVQTLDSDFFDIDMNTEPEEEELSDDLDDEDSYDDDDVASAIFEQISVQESQKPKSITSAAQAVFSDMEADIRREQPKTDSKQEVQITEEKSTDKNPIYTEKNEANVKSEAVQASGENNNDVMSLEPPIKENSLNPNAHHATNLTADELTDFFNAQQKQNTPVTTQIEGNTPKTNTATKKGPYVIPSDLLTAYKDDQYWIIDDETKQASINLKQTLAEFHIDADVIGIKKGPVVTMFELLPAPGVKLSKIVTLQDNIALSLAAQSVRIVAPIPGKQAVGIEVPNKNRSVVGFREIIEMNLPEWNKMAVPVVLGKDILGKAQLIDLVKTPHMLIAGATGSGKSVCVNSLILSILYKRSFKDVKLILVDPKVVELKLYNNIPHLLTPVITEPKKALQALQYCLCEMERRYALLDGLGVRDISSYNQRIKERNICTEKLPYIVVIIDEFADLMATSGKELESIVARLTAMSRAVGIHLVLATQRPSVNVITGLIKANIPTRIAFMVASRTDSNIIIDSTGAEKLLGRGDMLYASAVDPYPIRIQGTFVTDQEVEDVVNCVKQYGEPDYIDDEIFVDDDEDSNEDVDLFGNAIGEDPLYDQALEIVVQAGKASASYIQRRLKIGYNRAARLVEEMEERGIVGPANGSKPREVIHIP